MRERIAALKCGRLSVYFINATSPNSKASTDGNLEVGPVSLCLERLSCVFSSYFKTQTP